MKAKLEVISTRNVNVLQYHLGGKAISPFRKRDFGLEMCPAHSDTQPNLMIRMDDTGETRISCRCGCLPERVEAKLRKRGLQLAEVIFTDVEPGEIVEPTLPNGSKKAKGSKKRRAGK
jgi:hypothetical protein